LLKTVKCFAFQGVILSFVAMIESSNRNWTRLAAKFPMRNLARSAGLACCVHEFAGRSARLCSVSAAGRPDAGSST